MIAKHEHYLAQQKAMLESVRSQLAEVRDTVGALRAWVSETKEPPINSIVPPLPLTSGTSSSLDNGGMSCVHLAVCRTDFLPIDTRCTTQTQ